MWNRIVFDLLEYDIILLFEKKKLKLTCETFKEKLLVFYLTAGMYFGEDC